MADEPAEASAPAVDPDAGPFRPSSEQLALGLFVAYVAVAAPLLLFRYGDYHWFFRDDLEFLTDRAADGRPPWLEPHGGAHLVAVPRLVSYVLWQFFGMRSYLPYQACVVALHLTVAVLLRVVMRRAGVGPWLASAIAAVFVLFGPGAQNIVWAFQVTFTGALAWGLAQLVLADHDGPIGRRDLVALGFGVLAVASSGVGIATTMAVGVAVLVRRGWKAAAVQTVPLGLLYVGWVIAFDASTGEGLTPTVGLVAGWVRETYLGAFEAVGRWPVLTVVLAIGAGAGLVLLVRGASSPLAALRRIGVPIGLAVGGLAFTLMTAWGRAGIQPAELARSSRYVHIVAATILPLLAVGLAELGRRWPRAAPVLVAVVLLPIPFNLGGFTPPVFGQPYMDERERLLTTAPRVEVADEVPPWVQPVPDPFMGEVTMGFLRGAARTGDLPAPSEPIDEETENEFKVRLGVAVVEDPTPPDRCEELSGPTGLSPEPGDRFSVVGRLAIATREGTRATGPGVEFSGSAYVPTVVEVQLDDLELLVSPRERSFLCTEE